MFFKQQKKACNVDDDEEQVDQIGDIWTMSGNKYQIRTSIRIEKYFLTTIQWCDILRCAAIISIRCMWGILVCWKPEKKFKLLSIKNDWELKISYIVQVSLYVLLLTFV
jgi:hypothetical protein